MWRMNEDLAVGGGEVLDDFVHKFSMILSLILTPQIENMTKEG